jgi:tetratricopeptide (TPR) repeat protein
MAFMAFAPLSLKLSRCAIMLTVAAGLAFTSHTAYAVGGDEETPTSSETSKIEYQTAKRAIDAGRYNIAIPILEKLVKAEPRNANGWNLLAYSNRKLKKYDKALAQYRTALAIDSKHLGAHEYLGELYLALGDFKSAMSIRKRLALLCARGCSELVDLDKAIAAYRTGKKPGGDPNSHPRP